MADESPARITRVRLKNYKSIVSCDVELRPLTILVGPNGSGKSNFLDALRFVSEALTGGLEQAIRNRGNAQRILSKGRPLGDDSFGIALEFRLESGKTAGYHIEIEVQSDGVFDVVSERIWSSGDDLLLGEPWFVTEEGGLSRVRPNSSGRADASHDSQRINPLRDRPATHLSLGRVSFVGAPNQIRDLLTSMAFYNPVPERLRVLAPSELSEWLMPDGKNVASILRRIETAVPETMWRIATYLSRVLPGLERIDVQDLRGYDLLTVHQNGPAEGEQWELTPDQMSDGTLRALVVLAALFQHRIGGKSQVSLVGIEEPETGLHPAAARILLSAMQDASYTTQVLATTHSADMLHFGAVDVESLLAVEAIDGVTNIGRIDSVGRSILKDRLATAGELLQARLLHPETDSSDTDGGSRAAEHVAR